MSKPDRCADYIRAVVAGAPRLTPEQIRHLRELLPPVRVHAGHPQERAA